MTPKKGRLRPRRLQQARGRKGGRAATRPLTPPIIESVYCPSRRAMSSREHRAARCAGRLGRLFDAGCCPVAEITFRACTGSAGALAENNRNQVRIRSENIRKPRSALLISALKAISRSGDRRCTQAASDYRRLNSRGSGVNRNSAAWMRRWAIDSGMERGG
jgi:hypothetical protein